MVRPASRPAAIVTALALCLAVLWSDASGAPPGSVREGFEGSSGSAQGNTTGRPGSGWTQASSDDGLLQPFSPTRDETGIVSFDLQRKPVPASGDLDTVFEFLDAEGLRVLRMQVMWAHPVKGTLLLINSAPGRDYLQDGLALWSPVIPLDREVEPGGWVHIDLTWDDARSDYRAFADRAPLEARSGVLGFGTDGVAVPDLRPALNEAGSARGGEPPYARRPFRHFLERTAGVAFGSHPLTRPSAGRPRALLDNSVLDNFEIRTGRIAVIESVAHDAISSAGYSGSLVAGDRLTVVLTAQPGGIAAFDIDGVAAGNPMAELAREPGTYVGAFTVRSGDVSATGRVVGHFSSYTGFAAEPAVAAHPAPIDGRTRLAVGVSAGLVPADRSALSRIAVKATDANGRTIKGRRLVMALSTTDEYTGTVGGGSLEDDVGATLAVDWGGVTDSFGEVTAQFRSGFAAKTVLVSARDMVSGDVGVGWVRSFIEGTVEILVRQPQASALSFSGTLEAVSSRPWLTADGRSRSRITATVRDGAGTPAAGHILSFSLVGDNGSIRVVQARTDRNGVAYADYTAGLRIGQAVIEVRDQTSGLWTVAEVELRPDAPARISLAADPVEVVIGGSGATVTATVTDANGNPNRDVVVSFSIASGVGSLSESWAGTDPETGRASVAFMPGVVAGTAVVRGTVSSRDPTAGEVEAARGAVFPFGLAADPGPLTVERWLVKAGDPVSRGQGMAVLRDRTGTPHTVFSPRDGKVSPFAAEAGDEVAQGQALAYVLP